MSAITPERFPDLPVHLVDDWRAAAAVFDRRAIPAQVRLRYVQARSQGQSHRDAIRFVFRHDSWRRRKHEAQPCDRCGEVLTLWRRENGRSVRIDMQGNAHACEGL